MSDLISIIVPSYNSEKYIGRCLNSLLNQTHQKIEILVVNDGSTDRTLEITKEYQQKDKRIKIIDKPNTGVSDTRNKGIEIANGDLIGFVDSDDEAYPDMYEFLLKNMIKYDADISHCGFEAVRAEEVVQFHGTAEILVQNKREGLQELLSGKRVEPSACNKLYKKSILNQVRFHTNIKINEDLVFNIEAFKNAEISVFEDVIKYRYLSNPQSASHSQFEIEKSKHVYRATQEVKVVLGSLGLKNEVAHFYAGKLLSLYQGLRTNDATQTDFGKELRNEILALDVKELGLRLRVLKLSLVKYPFLYVSFRFVYDLFFMKNQKWKNH